MCGHFGVAGNITHKEEKLFRQGLIVDSLRGEHSTGVCAVYKGEMEPAIVKQVGDPFELFNDKRFDKALLPAKRVLIGHNRYATMGKINKYNAHPFHYRHVYGAHNGTLRMWHNLEGHRDFEVDSQALFNHISMYGVVDAINNIQGAWALVWWDSDKEELNFLRNDQREFFIAVEDNSQRIYWASEYDMLQLVLNRNNVKYQEITPLSEDTWVRFPINRMGEIDKPKVKKVAAKKIESRNQTIWTGGNNVQQTSSTSTHTALTPKSFTYDSAVIRDNVVMEIGKKFLDKRRAAYALCTDAANPKSKIRLYLKAGDEFLWKEGFIIVGRIGAFTSEENGYYKVTHSSVRLGTTAEQIQYDEMMKGEGEETSVVKFFDHKGNLLTKEEWEKKYPVCAWCSDTLVAEDKNYVSNDGDVLCPGCSQIDDVKQYL